MRYATIFLLALALLGLPATHASAQSVDDATSIEAELRDIAASPTTADADRRDVRTFLGQDRVRDVAADLGIDLDRVEERVATLNGEEVAGLAERIRDAAQEQPLAGGDTLVITSTTVIIVLLIIIIVIAA